MQNNKLQKIFFKTFLVTMICVVLVTGIGIVAYEVINSLFKEDTANQKINSVQSLNIITDVTLGTPSIELIYDADSNDSKINHMVVAIFNTKVHNLDYVTIPVNTQVTISDELYAQLVEISSSLPQTIAIGDVVKYFNGKEAYEYGELILEDAIGVKMSYYTKITSTEFANYFVEKEMAYYQPAKTKFSDTLVYSDAFISSFASVKPETVINFLTDFNNATMSNLSLANRTTYANDYAQVDYTKIYYWHLFGDYGDGGQTFTPNKDLNKKLFNTILSNVTYTITQAEYNETQKKASASNSKKLNIQILNGGGIKGLAGRWKTKLTSDGYKIVAVGDYSQDDLKSTKIISKSESVGLDLLKYFKNATIEVGTVPEGYNLIIVVGSEDDFEE